MCIFERSRGIAMMMGGWTAVSNPRNVPPAQSAFSDAIPDEAAHKVRLLSLPSLRLFKAAGGGRSEAAHLRQTLIGALGRGVEGRRECREVAPAGHRDVGTPPPHILRTATRRLACHGENVETDGECEQCFGS